MRTTLALLLLVGGLVLWVVLFLAPGEPADQRAAGVPEAPAVYDPVAAGEATPEGFRQLLARDRIEPIYDPVLVDADEVDWDEDTLVLGVEIDGEAHAYPIRPLNHREIVNDRIADTPLVASW